ncbi:MAG: PfaD family polyunsaturated fatty acid/polyketide biosynthesis protein, partial [Gammaproteobacteria bacterium]|nr:PfaD family polyunsaturated fatty acid/polyketide biosynthesis protein [Gammaproteobacteria bacterium]
DAVTTTILQNQSFILPWNDIEAVETLVRNHGDEIGAILMEPICFNGGGIMPAPGYLSRIREICDKNNIVLIFDEVITGFRVGLGGAQSLVGITPDLAVFGKALAGGGVPVSLIAGKKDIMSLYSKAKVVHLGTFNGYPLGLAGVSATIELLSENGCYERMGGYMLKIAESMVATAKEVGIPMVIQGLPTALVFNIQETQAKNSDVIAHDVKLKNALVRNVCRKYGLQISPLSRLYANLMLNQNDVDFFKQRIGDALFEAKQQLIRFNFL